MSDEDLNRTRDDWVSENLRIMLPSFFTQETGLFRTALCSALLIHHNKYIKIALDETSYRAQIIYLYVIVFIVSSVQI